MMKKILAMLSAAVLGCCMLTAPAFAADEAAQETEQTYQLGDVDMDGEITAADAQLVLREYVKRLALSGGSLNDEQIARSHVLGLEAPGKVYSTDAMLILQYSVKKLAGYPESELSTFFTYWAQRLSGRSDIWDSE